MQEMRHGKPCVTGFSFTDGDTNMDLNEKVDALNEKVDALIEFVELVIRKTTGLTWLETQDLLAKLQKIKKEDYTQPK